MIRHRAGDAAFSSRCLNIFAMLMPDAVARWMQAWRVMWKHIRPADLLQSSVASPCSTFRAAIGYQNHTY